jgi:hypothetical protein
VPVLIESRLPATWQDLETNVVRILRECGGRRYAGPRRRRRARFDDDAALWQLLAVAPGTVLAVGALTAVPARISARRPVAGVLQSELA